MPPHVPSPSLCRFVYAYPPWSASSRDQAYDASHVCLGPHVPHPTPRHATFGRRRSRRLGPTTTSDGRTSGQAGREGGEAVRLRSRTRVRGARTPQGPRLRGSPPPLGPLITRGGRWVRRKWQACARVRVRRSASSVIAAAPRAACPRGGRRNERRKARRRATVVPTAGQGSPAAAARIDDVRGGFNRRHATPVRPGEPILSSKLPRRPVWSFVLPVVFLHNAPKMAFFAPDVSRARRPTRGGAAGRAICKLQTPRLPAETPTPPAACGRPLVRLLPLSPLRPPPGAVRQA